MSSKENSSPLNNRKLRILTALVDIYIRTGDPVGSRTLLDEAGFSLSPATIRKEMSELIRMGLLEQPHTSAGRVPSGRGYRLYIESLPKGEPLSEDERAMIRKSLETTREPGKLIDDASSALARLTNCMAVATSPGGEEACVLRIEVIMIGPTRTLLVCAASTGFVKTRVAYGVSRLSDDFCRRFTSLANELLAGEKLRDIPDDKAKALISLFSDCVLAAAQIVSALSALMREAGRFSIRLEGESNLYGRQDLDSAEIARILDLFGREESINLVKSGDSPISIIIGDGENPLRLKGISVIMTDYSLKKGGKGSLGIIGPTRMNYPKLISSIEYFAKELAGVFDEMLDE